MLRTLEALSLRTKITASFVLIVVFGTALSTGIGSRIVTRGVLEQARTRAVHGLETARLVYQAREDQVCRAVAQAARAPDPQNWRDPEGTLDFLAVVAPGDAAGAPALVSLVNGREPVGGTEWIPRSWLQKVAPDLGVPAGGRRNATLAIACAAGFGRTGRAWEVAVGGILLEGDTAFMAEIQRVIFGGETHGDRSVGLVAIFADGRQVAGDHPGGEPYLYRRGPLMDGRDRATAELAVGILEAPFLAVRTDMMLSFLLVAGLAVVVLMGLTYGITRNTIRPLEEMAAATRRIAQGDLDTRVQVRAHDEIGQLAASFNQMLDSLRLMHSELESWGQTLEEKIKARTEELAQVQRQMLESEKMASLGRMAAGVAHELNNPLGGILSLSMLSLEELPPDHPIREDLDTISKQALRCREIVKGLLEFSRRKQRSTTRTDVVPVVESTLALLEKQATFHDVDVVRQLDDDLPQVRIDPGQLQQVVMNLLFNAVEAMDEHGTVTIVCEHDPQSEEVLIRIRDTGRGIPEEVLPYIFEPFFTTKGVGAGTGLGLAIVHGIVIRAGGRVQVSSNKNGTTFTVRLPAASEDDDGRGKVEDDAETTAGAGARESASG